MSEKVGNLEIFIIKEASTHDSSNVKIKLKSLHRPSTIFESKSTDTINTKHRLKFENIPLGYYRIEASCEGYLTKNELVYVKFSGGDTNWKGHFRKSRNSINLTLKKKSGYQGIRGWIMKYGELHYKKGVESFFNNWRSYIISVANRNHIDPILMFAIFKEELSHMLPGEYPAEVFLGLGDTVGPGQININVWSKKLNANRDALTDISINIDSVADILSEEQIILKSKGLTTSPEMLGSRYNNRNSTTITDYGLRVGAFYKELKLHHKKQK